MRKPPKYGTQIMHRLTRTLRNNNLPYVVYLKNETLILPVQLNKLHLYFKDENYITVGVYLERPFRLMTANFYCETMEELFDKLVKHNLLHKKNLQRILY